MMSFLNLSYVLNLSLNKYAEGSASYGNCTKNIFRYEQLILTLSFLNYDLKNTFQWFMFSTKHKS